MKNKDEHHDLVFYVLDSEVPHSPVPTIGHNRNRITATLGLVVHAAGKSSKN